MAKDDDKVKDDVKDDADTSERDEAEKKAEAKDEAEKKAAKSEEKAEEETEAKDEAEAKKDEGEEKAAKSEEKAEPKKAAKPAAKDEAEKKAEAKDDGDEEEEEEEEARAGSSDEEEEEEEEVAAASSRKSDRVVGASPARSAEVHAEAYGDGEAALSEGAHDELAHITPVTLLFKVWAALMVFTILTVAASYIDFGGQGNLVVALIIATIKASLVVVFFMHLRWDRRFHALTFLSGFLFVLLFIGLALTDRAEYQPMIKAYQDAQAQTHGGLRLGPQP